MSSMEVVLNRGENKNLSVLCLGEAVLLNSEKRSKAERVRAGISTVRCSPMRVFIWVPMERSCVALVCSMHP